MLPVGGLRLCSVFPSTGQRRAVCPRPVGWPGWQHAPWVRDLRRGHPSVAGRLGDLRQVAAPLWAVSSAWVEARCLEGPRPGLGETCVEGCGTGASGSPAPCPVLPLSQPLFAHERPVGETRPPMSPASGLRASLGSFSDGMGLTGPRSCFLLHFVLTYSSRRLNIGSLPAPRSPGASSPYFFLL